MKAVVEQRADGAWLVMSCQKFGRCEVPVTTGPAGDDPKRGRVWHWDGNAKSPSITPSIGCDTAPRCGQHRVITAGTWAAAHTGSAPAAPIDAAVEPKP